MGTPEFPGRDVIVPRKHPWRWVGSIIVVLIAITIVISFFTNENYQWDVVAKYLFDPRIMQGLSVTLILTVVCMVIAVVLGLVLAIMRLSESQLLQKTAGVYIWFFRGTPILVQLILWYNLAILVPEMGIGIPFVGNIVSVSTNDIITPWTAAILGLALNEAAYISEIIRSGIMSVDKGQDEAAQALGMGKTLAFRRVILPQALRIIVPPAFNEAVGLLKYSSIVSIIALPELLYSGQLIYARTYETIPILIVVCIWYLVVVTVMTYFESLLERKLGAGHAPQAAVKTDTRRWARWVTLNNRS